MFAHSQVYEQKPRKSQIQIKRENFQSLKAQQEKDKIKKSMRFSVMAQLAIQRDQSEFDFILQIQDSKVQNILLQYIQTNQTIPLAYCISKIQYKIDILSKDFFEKFVQFSETKITKPEIIYSIKALIGASYDFRQTMFQNRTILDKIIKEIKSLKQSNSQQIYLQILQFLTPSYLKRNPQKSGQIFDVFSSALDNKGVQFRKALKILKTISPYINEQKTFSSPTIQLISLTYEEQSKKQNPSQSLMIDCFLVLTKIIFYQTGMNLVTNLKLMKIVIDAKSRLPSKIIEEYYNIFSLLAKLVEKTAKYQIQQISEYDKMLCVKRLSENFPKMQFNVPISRNYLTSIILNYIFEKNPEIFEWKQFEAHYLNFILQVCLYCEPQILINCFKDSNFFQFLGEAIEHRDLQVNYMALQIIYSLIQQETNCSQVFIYFTEYTDVKKILQNKLYQRTNKRIEEKIQAILDIFDQFNSH